MPLRQNETINYPSRSFSFRLSGKFVTERILLINLVKSIIPIDGIPIDKI